MGVARGRARNSNSLARRPTIAGRLNYLASPKVAADEEEEESYKQRLESDLREARKIERRAKDWPQNGAKRRRRKRLEAVRTRPPIWRSGRLSCCHGNSPALVERNFRARARARQTAAGRRRIESAGATILIVPLSVRPVPGAASGESEPPARDSSEANRKLFSFIPWRRRRRAQIIARRSRAIGGSAAAAAPTIAP